jgi:hypothetical protein
VCSGAAAVLGVGSSPAIPLITVPVPTLDAAEFEPYFSGLVMGHLVDIDNNSIVNLAS